MNKLFVATLNKGKIREIRDILSDTEINIITPEEMNMAVDVLEDGATFLENAIKKATSWMKATHLNTLADDSGLMVDALGGKPGVFSARFSGKDATDEKNCELLLKSMEGIDDRKAKFVCVVALVMADGRIVFAKGEYPGLILKRPIGENGFGYDPVFFDPVVKRTFAQLSKKEKNAVSHRRKALQALKLKLETLGILR